MKTLTQVMAAAALAMSVSAGNATELSEGAQKMIHHMMAIKGDRNQIEVDIRHDCEFRYKPDSQRVKRCFVDRRWDYIQMRKLFDTLDIHHRVAIAWCMDRNKTLKNYEWTNIPRCYERVAAELR